MIASPSNTADVRFLVGTRLLAFRLGVALHGLKYLLQRKRYPLFRLGLFGDGALKTYRLMRRIGLRKVVQMGDRFFSALTMPHYPSPAFDNVVAHGGFNTASAGTPLNRHISTAILAITRTCNLHCQHCYERFNIGSDEEVPISRWEEVIRELQVRGTSVIVLSGGEPMLRFDGLLELLRSGDQNLSDFHIHTSGQGVTAEKVCRLREAGLTAAAVGLDDVDERRHDTLRGYTGAHRDAVRALQIFHEAGVFTYVNICVTRELIRTGDLWKYFALAKALKVGFIQMLEPRPCGGYLKNVSDVLLTEEDRSLLMRFFEDGNRKSEFNDYPIIYSVARAESPGYAGCMMGGLFHFHIDSRGNVNPCVFLPVSFGNIMKEDFSMIFQRMREAVPRPLHVQCPSLQLGETLRQKSAEASPMPIPFKAIETEWRAMMSRHD